MPKKKTDLPSVLYKYCSLPDLDDVNNQCFTLENLTNNNLWFSEAKELNDPFDCQVPINLRISKTSLRLYLEQRQKNDPLIDVERTVASSFDANGKLTPIGKKINDSLSSKVEEVNAKLGVSCFSTKNNSILMWSHYANKHQGICLEFTTGKYPLVKIASDSTLHVFKKVKYLKADRYPEVSLKNFLDGSPKTLKAFLCKAFDWRYEKEWRLVVDHGEDGICYQKESLSGVIFGLNMEDDLKEKVRASLAGSPDVIFYQAKRSKTKYGVSIERLNT
jgi:Protein of unknown function (DUF2971)